MCCSVSGGIEGRRGDAALPRTQQVCPLGSDQEFGEEAADLAVRSKAAGWGRVVGGPEGMPSTEALSGPQRAKLQTECLNIKVKARLQRSPDFFGRYAQKCKTEGPRMAVFKSEEDPVQGTPTGDQHCAWDYRSRGLSYPLVGRTQHFQNSSQLRTGKIKSQGGIKNTRAWRHKEIKLTK